MELINEMLNQCLIELKQGKNNTGISTGFYNLDYLINSLNEGKVIVIAARPAMGKTSFALNIAINVAVKEKLQVAIFSLEMSRKQCINRFIALRSLVNINKIQNNNLNNEEYEKVKTAVKDLSEANIYLDDTPAIFMEEIRKKCIKLKNEKDIKLIVIDYLQLIQNSSNENMCVLLKNLAQELDVPVIVTSQLSRAPQGRFEKGEDPRPRISDIDSSTSKEADVLLFLHRDDYYNTDIENKDITELIIAKNKNKFGDIGTVKLLFRKDYLKYENIEGDIEE